MGAPVCALHAHARRYGSWVELGGEEGPSPRQHPPTHTRSLPLTPRWWATMTSAFTALRGRRGPRDLTGLKRCEWGGVQVIPPTPSPTPMPTPHAPAQAFRPVERVALEQNYRCPASLLHVANTVAAGAPSPSRRAKRLWTTRPRAQPRVDACECRTEAVRCCVADSRPARGARFHHTLTPRCCHPPGCRTAAGSAKLRSSAGYSLCATPQAWRGGTWLCCAAQTAPFAA